MDGAKASEIELADIDTVWLSTRIAQKIPKLNSAPESIVLDTSESRQLSYSLTANRWAQSSVDQSNESDRHTVPYIDMTANATLIRF